MGPSGRRGLAASTVNLTYNCVDRHAQGAAANRPAIVWESEDEQVRTLSYAELRVEVDRLCRGLLELGVGHGDAVGIYLPMSPEVAIAFFAVAKLGAIAVPIFSGFAAPAVAARLADAAAVCVITADAVPRKGRPVAMKQVVDEACTQAPTVRSVVVWDRLGLRTAHAGWA